MFILTPNLDRKPIAPSKTRKSLPNRSSPYPVQMSQYPHLSPLFLPTHGTKISYVNFPHFDPSKQGAYIDSIPQNRPPLHQDQGKLPQSYCVANESPDMPRLVSSVSTHPALPAALYVAVVVPTVRAMKQKPINPGFFALACAS